MYLDKDGRTLTERLSNARRQSQHITELIGLCRGVLADGAVNIQEATFILQWLNDRPQILKTWPADYLYRILGEILARGGLANEDESELAGLLAEITGAPVKVIYSTDTSKENPAKVVERTLNTPTELPINYPKHGMEFKGRYFVLTGTFSQGSRMVCEEIVRASGGVSQKNVTGSTNYLVIGSIGSESWAHSSFGRKIEKAVYTRESGQEIYIVNEEYWIEQLRKAVDGLIIN